MSFKDNYYPGTNNLVTKHRLYNETESLLALEYQEFTGRHTPRFKQKSTNAFDIPHLKISIQSTQANTEQIWYYS